MAEAPLTESETFQCFQLAGVIWDDFNTASIHDGFGVQLSLTDLSILQSDLRARLVALSDPALVEVRVFIVKWAAVKYSTASMEGGAVGSTTGLKYDPKDKRENVKELFASTLGLMGMAQAQAAKRKAMMGENSDNGCIGVVRG